MWLSYVVKQALSAAFTLLRVLGLRAHNLWSRARIPATGPVEISLTTHGRRLATVFLAIESVARGTTRAPITLWLDPVDYDSEWPANLRRLVRRGLNVRRGSGGIGPHAKYWDMFRQVEGTGTRVVTIDDDIIYPRGFLTRLHAIAELRHDTVVAYRAHRIEIADGRLQPYMKWTPANTSNASILHFATGVSGVEYPPAFISYVVSQGLRFMDVSPRADDVWLHVCAIRSGHLVRQVFAQPRNFAVVPSTQLSSLVLANGVGGGNDEQIAQAYSDKDIAVLCAASAEED